MRRMRPDGPRLGHSFTTIEDGAPVSWSVIDEEFAHDEQGEPFLDLVAERDYGEAEGDLPDHELEHALTARSDEVPDAARERIDEATRLGFAIESSRSSRTRLPDWEEARRYIETLSLDTIADDLLELCGVDTEELAKGHGSKPSSRASATTSSSFSADVKGTTTRSRSGISTTAASSPRVGSVADESDPDRGHGWLCRLLDAVRSVRPASRACESRSSKVWD